MQKESNDEDADAKRREKNDKATTKPTNRPRLPYKAELVPWSTVRAVDIAGTPTPSPG
jgi:hypothetical protein